MTLEDFLAYCSRKPGVTADHPMGGETVWMKVGGKMFAIANVGPMNMGGRQVAPFHFINLKCDPDRAVELRDAYPEIRPGWHQNKTHWNTVLTPETLPEMFLSELIDHSYALVFGTLAKAAKAKLVEDMEP